MILETVTELPDHVRLSPHLRERAEFYVVVLSFGVGYYIPATPKVQRLLGIDSRGRWVKKPPSLRQWDRRRFDNADALRDIAEALYLQLRDVELAEIERNVKEPLLDRMDEALTRTVRGMIAANLPGARQRKQLMEGGKHETTSRNDAAE